MSLVLFPTKNYSNYERDVESILRQDGRIVAKVEDASSAYREIDTDKTMQELTRVGDLLEVAYVSSKGFPCSTPVMVMLMDYQAITKDSHVSCSQFLQASLEAMKFHSYALRMMDKNDPSKALKFVGATAKLAGAMVKVSSDLVNKCQAMCERGEAAVCQATIDHSGHTTEATEIQKRIATTKANEAKLREMTVKFQQDLASAIEDEKIAAQTAEEERRSVKRMLAMTVSPFVVVAEMISGKTILSESASKKEARLHKDRLCIQAKEREMLGELAETVSRLANTSVTKSNLDKAIESLELATRVLGKVKTVFENTRRFWMVIQEHCQKLSDTDNFKLFEEVGDNDMLREAISDNGYSWMALAQMNHTAVKAIAAVSNKVDDVMSNLPTSAEAEKRLPSLYQQISADLQDDINRIEESDRVTLIDEEP